MTACETTDEDRTLCALGTGGFSFGIDIRHIRDVPAGAQIQKVPFAPHFIAGVVSSCGAVLSTISLRALLAMPPYGEESCFLDLDGHVQWHGDAEQFGLTVDVVGGVVAVGEDLLASNPPPLNEHLRHLFQAAYGGKAGLIVQFDPERLRPERRMLPGTF